MRCIKINILVIVLIQSIGISAQSVISGRIIDKDSIPLTGVTILLLNHTDSAYLKSSISDLNGQIDFADLKPDNYILSISMMGFKRINIWQQVEQNTVNKLGDIMLEEDSYI